MVFVGEHDQVLRFAEFMYRDAFDKMLQIYYRPSKKLIWNFLKPTAYKSKRHTKSATNKGVKMLNAKNKKYKWNWIKGAHGYGHEITNEEGKRVAILDCQDSVWEEYSTGFSIVPTTKTELPKKYSRPD